MAWLPPPSVRPPRRRRPWTPPALGGVETKRLRYLVVDEMVGASVGLTLSPWPTVDDEGRVRFVEGERRTLGADQAALERFLAQHRRPPELAARPLRIGDVFAVQTVASALAAVEEELAAPRRMEPFLAPEEWIEPPVYDVTADAREAAKASFYGAVAPVLAPGEAAMLDEIVERAHEQPPVGPPSRSWRARNLRWLAASSVLFAGGIAAGVALGGGVGGSTTRVTTPITVTERATDLRTATATSTVIVGATVTEVRTTTEQTATTETSVTTETVTTTLTTTVTVTTTPPVSTLG